VNIFAFLLLEVDLGSAAAGVPLLTVVYLARCELVARRMEMELSY